jgi:hypothetical protein
MKSVKTLMLLFISLLFFTYCSDNSTGPDDEHADAVGMRIVSSGVTIVSYIRDGALTGHIEAEAGEMTGHMDIEFYDDEDDEWFTPEEDHYELSIEIEDTTIAQYWQHEGDEGGFEFHIRGINEGHTHAVFSIIHDDHPDFVSREIEIHVEHGHGNGHDEPEGIHLVKESSGDTLASWDMHDGVEGDDIVLANGTESGHIEVVFFTHEGHQVNPGSEYFLEFSVDNTDIAEIEQHDTTNEPWAFEISAKSTGSTTFTIKLIEIHDDHNHEVFHTEPFTITVQ